MEMEENNVGQNLKRLRSLSGFTQDQIATFVGITRSAYSNYESGERETPCSVIDSLSNLYGCDPYDLFSEDITKENAVIATAFRISDLSNEDMLSLIHI